jgi:hypothetical protein
MWMVPGENARESDGPSPPYAWLPFGCRRGDVWVAPYETRRDDGTKRAVRVPYGMTQNAILEDFGVSRVMSAERVRVSLPPQ